MSQAQQVNNQSIQNHTSVSNLVRVQQAVVDSELHQLGQQVQNLPLQGHRGAGGVLLQSLDHQGLKEPDVVVNRILAGKRTKRL